jgi:hypothetical protein
MGVNFAPIPDENATSSLTVQVSASASYITFAAVPSRMGGTIYNKSTNRSLWIKRGDPSVSPLLTANPIFEEVPAGGNWEIPTEYDGVLGLVWSAGFNGSSYANIVQNMP